MSKRKENETEIEEPQSKRTRLSPADHCGLCSRNTENKLVVCAHCGITACKECRLHREYNKYICIKCAEILHGRCKECSELTYGYSWIETTCDDCDAPIHQKCCVLVEKSDFQICYSCQDCATKAGHVVCELKRQCIKRDKYGGVAFSKDHSISNWRCSKCGKFACLYCRDRDKPELCIGCTTTCITCGKIITEWVFHLTKCYDCKSTLCGRCKVSITVGDNGYQNSFCKSCAKEHLNMC